MSPLLAHQDAVWMLIDVQTRLCDAMPASEMAAVVNNCQRLIHGAQLLEIPLWVTEQSPEKLGPTLPSLDSLLPQHTPRMAKRAFSAWHAAAFQAAPVSLASQVVLFGLETHICVLQTALDALAAGKQVFVLEDAVISRAERHRLNALDRMRAAGCIISNTESVLFEPLKSAEHPQFKAISALIK